MKKQKVELFGMPFLDVLTCGLGAVLIVTLLYTVNVTKMKKRSTNLSEVVGGMTNVIQSISNAWAGITLHCNTLSKQLELAGSSNQFLMYNFAEEKEELTKLVAYQTLLVEKARKTKKWQKEELEKLKFELDMALKDEKKIISKYQYQLQEINREKKALDIFGLRIKEHNIVFVIDNSKSMTYDSRLEDVRGAFKVVFSAMARAGTYKATVISFCDEEFEREAEGIKKYFPFTDKTDWKNIIKFCWTDLKKINDTTRWKMLDFIDNLKPEGGTPTVAAILNALNVPEIEAIVLLSDGRPMSKFTDANKGRECEAALEEILRINDDKKIPIYTVGVGKEMGERFSKAKQFIIKLAQETDAQSITF